MLTFDDIMRWFSVTNEALKAQIAVIQADVATLADMISSNDPPPDDSNPLDIFDMSRWTLTLPIAKPGTTDSPQNAYPSTSIANIFFVRGAGVVFRCLANGVHTAHSDYCRTELRQMRDTKWTESAWSSGDSHSMTIDQSIDVAHLTTRKRIVAGQIHDANDDVCQIVYDISNGLTFVHNNGKDELLIDPNYQNNQRHSVKLLAEKDRIKVNYNGNQVVDIPKKGSGWYFKAGCYVQTGGASSHLEPADAYGETTIYALSTTGAT